MESYPRLVCLDQVEALDSLIGIAGRAIRSLSRSLEVFVVFPFFSSLVLCFLPLQFLALVISHRSHI